VYLRRWDPILVRSINAVLLKERNNDGISERLILPNAGGRRSCSGASTYSCSILILKAELYKLVANILGAGQA
jgi:hypothetical protein